jgi:hypothetical protein
MNPGAFTFKDTVYFAGGDHCNEPVNCSKGVSTDTVEFYNPSTKTWKYTDEKLPTPLSMMSCVSLDTAVVCAKPPNYYVWKGPGSQWTTVKQSIFRIEHGFAAVAGRWAVFAGGEAQPDDHSKAAGERVDIYDSKTDKWTVPATGLSSPKKKLACGGADDLAVCGGGFASSGHDGYMDTVDVFNLTSGTRVSSKLQSKRMFLGGGGANHFAVIAGGLDADVKENGFNVDIYDARTGTMSHPPVSQTMCGAHRYFLTSATVQDRFIFFGPGMGGKGPPATVDIDMYDTKTQYMYNGGINPALPLMTAMNPNGAAAGSCSYWANGGARSQGYHAVANQIQVYCVSGC